MKFKNLINESSLSRIWRQTKDNDSGTISAFRKYKDCGTDETYTLEENKNRSKLLKYKLLALGYSVTPIKGSYIEKYKTPDAVEVNEDSFLVVDLNSKGTLKKDLISLGTLYEQDSITFSDKGGEYYLISSNKCKDGYPGFGKIGVEVKLGKPLFGSDGEFYSKINGRPFVFQSLGESEVITDYSISEIRSIKESLKKGI